MSTESKKEINEDLADIAIKKFEHLNEYNQACIALLVKKLITMPFEEYAQLQRDFPAFYKKIEDEVIAISIIHQNVCR